ncbi:MAG: GNAT family N-acetyltransferase [Candidatus Dormibacteraeota bacterium]|nr:GNAT family N-acetyltransferase [Candidatus Dormibacteraeota bacterium]
MRNPVLVGERVYLRGIEPSDAETLAWLDAVEEDTFMYRWRVPIGPLQRTALAEREYKVRPPRNIAFAVCLRQDDRLLGMVGVIDIDWVHRNGETFSGLGPAGIRGQGYGTEAKHLLLGYCFDKLGLHVLRSEVAETNTRSAAALRKQGYRRAGSLKWADVKGGRYIDQHLFDLTRDDWRRAHQVWVASRRPARDG